MRGARQAGRVAQANVGGEEASAKNKGSGQSFRTDQSLRSSTNSGGHALHRCEAQRGHGSAPDLSQYSHEGKNDEPGLWMTERRRLHGVSCLLETDGQAREGCQTLAPSSGAHDIRHRFPRSPRESDRRTRPRMADRRSFPRMPALLCKANRSGNSPQNISGEGVTPSNP